MNKAPEERRGLFSEELTQELLQCRERMENMRKRISNMNDDMSSFRHEYLDGFRKIKEHLDKQDEVLAEATATSRWIRDEYAVDMKKSVKDLVAPVNDLVEIFEAARGGLKVLGWFGTILKWVGYCAAAVASIWGLLQLIGKQHT